MSRSIASDSASRSAGASRNGGRVTFSPSQNEPRYGAIRSCPPNRSRSEASGCGGTVSVRCRPPASKRFSSLDASSVTWNRTRAIGAGSRKCGFRSSVIDACGSHAASRYAPLPTRFPGRVCRAPWRATDGRCTGHAVGSVSSRGRSTLRVTVNTTVRASGAATPSADGGTRPRCTSPAFAIASNCAANGAAVAGVKARRKLATTCGASRASPFDQRSPSRRWNVQARPSADWAHASAMPGISRPAPSSATSPSYRSRSTFAHATSGQRCASSVEGSGPLPRSSVRASSPAAAGIDVHDRRRRR